MRLFTRIALVLAVMVLLGSSGCAKRIGATYDPFVIFPATARWVWDEGLNRIADDPSMTTLNIRALVRETITEGLASRGYVIDPEGGEADFRVHYQVGIAKVVKPNSIEGYASLSVTLVEASTGRDAWMGFVKTDVNVARTEAERRKRLQKEVKQMLRKFPPSQPK